MEKPRGPLKSAVAFFLCLVVAAAFPTGASAQEKTKPALTSLLSAAGIDDLKQVEAPLTPAAAVAAVTPTSDRRGDGRLYFECSASPWGYGFSELLFLAQTQACMACRGSNKECRYQCYQRIGRRPLPFPISQGRCN